MLILQLRQAEAAMAQGRLDHAFDLLRTREVKGAATVDVVAARLAGAFVKRGGAHLKAQRLADAIADCDRALTLTGATAEVAHLRQAIGLAVAKQQRHAARRQGIVRMARRHLHRGRWSAVWRTLAQVKHSSAFGWHVRQDALMKQADLQTSLEQAAAACDRRDWLTAVRLLASAQAVDPFFPEVAELAGRVLDELQHDADAAFDAGHLDDTQTLIEIAQPLLKPGHLMQRLRRVMESLDRVPAMLKASQWREASLVLQRVHAERPAATWLKDATTAAQTAAEAAEALQVGPLVGLWHSTKRDLHSIPSRVADAAKLPASPNPTHVAPAHDAPTDLGSRFVLHVDGVGAYLVVRDARVSIGPISASARPMVGLLADAMLPVVWVQRSEEDYFLTSDRDVAVNEQTGKRHLLRDGAKIALSPRCRLTFRKPHAASTTAALQLTSAKLPLGDVRQVLLMDRDIVIGPGTAAHVRCDPLPTAVVIRWTQGGLTVRASEHIIVDERKVDAAAPLPTHKTIRIGDLSFTITPFEGDSSTTAA